MTSSMHKPLGLAAVTMAGALYMKDGALRLIELHAVTTNKYQLTNWWNLFNQNVNLTAMIAL